MNKNLEVKLVINCLLTLLILCSLVSCSEQDSITSANTSIEIYHNGQLIGEFKANCSDGDLGKMVIDTDTVYIHDNTPEVSSILKAVGSHPAISLSAGDYHFNLNPDVVDRNVVLVIKSELLNMDSSRTVEATWETHTDAGVENTGLVKIHNSDD